MVSGKIYYGQLRIEDVTVSNFHRLKIPAARQQLPVVDIRLHLERYLGGKIVKV